MAATAPVLPVILEAGAVQRTRLAAKQLKEGEIVGAELGKSGRKMERIFH